jgi:hypothetical protein
MGVYYPGDMVDVARYRCPNPCINIPKMFSFTGLIASSFKFPLVNAKNNINITQEMISP